MRGFSIPYLLRIHLVTLVSIVSMVVVSNILYFYLQQNNEEEIQKSLLTQYIALQNQSGKSIENGISSDLNSILKMIENVAQMQALKDKLTSMNTSPHSQNQNNALTLAFLNDQINSTYTDLSLKADRMYILNKNGIIINSFAPKNQDLFLGLDLSFRDYVKDTIQSKKPVFSGLFKGADGLNRIAITFPIMNNTNNLLQSSNNTNQSSQGKQGSHPKEDYLGLVAASIPVYELFQKYGNIYDVKRQFLVAYDRNGNIMASPAPGFVGKNFQDPEIQKVTNSNEVFNRIINNLLNGRQDRGLYISEGLGERYNTAFPIFMNEKFAYGIAVVTPINSIYENINQILSNGRVQSVLILTTMSAGVTTIALILRNWTKDMGKEVKKRTTELDEAKQRLEVINQKLVSSEKAKEEFISMVSHELRTPLMPIKAYAGMLLNPRYTGTINEKQKKAIDSILRNVTILERLVGDVLDVYKLEMTRLKLSKQDVNVKSLVENAATEFDEIIRTQDKEKIIELSTQIKIDKELRINCDPQRINQVLGNLIKNAIDFVPSLDGKINLSVEEYADLGINSIPGNTANRLALFTVKDNGPGIPPEKIDQLFKKFYQIDTSLTRKHGGTGLGLAICKGIIESHGGRIWLDKSYQGGACFKFTLPFA